MCLRARKRTGLKFTFFSPRFLSLLYKNGRDPNEARLNGRRWEKQTREWYLSRRSESISARECALFERVARSRGVLRRRDAPKFPRHFEDHQTRTKKGPERETNFPLRFFAWFSVEFSFSLFILSLVRRRLLLLLTRLPFSHNTGHVLSHENQRHRASICQHHLQEGGNRHGEKSRGTLRG